MTPAALNLSRRLSRLEKPLDWQELGACREPGRDPALWEADYGRKAQQARNVCWLHCKVRVRCLAFHLAMEGADSKRYRFGVAGGLFARERAELARDIRDRNKARAQQKAAA